MRLLQWSGYLFIVLLLLTAVVLGLGSRLPVEHTATVSSLIPASQQRIWALITDVEAQPRWRTGLKAVEVLPAGPNGPCWREIQTSMAMPLCVAASEAPRRRVVRIADPKLPFGGDWTYEIQQTVAATGGCATRVTITERGTTGPAMWRFFGHYVYGEDRSIRQYLKDLEGAGRGWGPRRRSHR